MTIAISGNITIGDKDNKDKNTNRNANRNYEISLDKNQRN